MELIFDAVLGSRWKFSGNGAKTTIRNLDSVVLDFG